MLDTLSKLIYKTITNLLPEGNASDGTAERWSRTGEKIQRELRAIKGAKRKAIIGRILSQFKGLKFIACIRKNEKRQFIASMRGKNGILRTDRYEIANVFVDFYEELYAVCHKDEGGSFEQTVQAIDAI